MGADRITVMGRWARLVTRRAVAWRVVVGSVLAALLCLYGALQVESDDDILAFLPADNPDVQRFYEINERFGELDVALVGIESDDVFSADFLGRLAEVTKNLEREPAISSALSLANVQDFTNSPDGGVETGLLVSRLPKDREGAQALREKVLSRDLVVGNLVSKDGRAVIIYAFAGFGADPRSLAETVHGIVDAGFPAEAKYWGGAPFVSSYIYNATQEDLQTLTPWAVLVIVLLIVLAFRDFLGAGLALVSTGMGISISMGLMGLLGVRYNIVLSSMPVILFAVGSAYAIHILAHYYRIAQDRPPTEALVKTMVSVGPTVFAAGMTTVAGLLSFLAMDIEPLGTFGVFTAVGIFATLLLSLTFVPAVIVLLGIGPKTMPLGRFNQALVHAVSGIQRHRVPFFVLLVLVAALGLHFASRVDTRMDQTSFFHEDSPPAEADRFLSEHFGGSNFLQVAVEGDVTDPAVLRLVERTADRIREIKDVTAVQHVGQVYAQANSAMGGGRRLPDTKAQLQLLARLTSGTTGIDMLITEDRQHALLHVKLATNKAAEAEIALDRVETLVSAAFPAHYRIVSGASAEADASRLAHVAGRIKGIGAEFGYRWRQSDAFLAILKRTDIAPDPATVAVSVLDYLGSDEALVELEAPMARSVSAAVVALGPSADPEVERAALARVLGPTADAELVDDLILSIHEPVRRMWQDSVQTKRLGLIVGALDWSDVPPAMFGRCLDALGALSVPTVLLPSEATAATGSLGHLVSGLPVLHRGLSRSVARNQVSSLATALISVLVILTFLFRSFWTGLLATMPTMLTLGVVYGGMGWLGVHLDIGTSMLASIIIGAGVDYAVHLVSAWNAAGDSLEDAARTAATRTGPAIWTNALMVAAGFFVLSLGQARTLQNVGGLTAVAMVAAAVTTFLTIPVLARRSRYSRTNEPVYEQLAEG